MEKKTEMWRGDRQSYNIKSFQDGTLQKRDVSAYSKIGGNIAGKDTSHDKAAQSQEENIFKKIFFRILCPLFLISVSPVFVMTLWYTVAHCGGSFAALSYKFAQHGFITTMHNFWSNTKLLDPMSYSIFFLYIVLQVLLMRFLPGKIVYGPLTPNGNRPVYRDNGLNCYLTTLIIFLTIAACLRAFTTYSITLVFDHFDQVLTTLNISSLFFCVFLCIKGYYYPSTSDNGSSGNILFDYYWGTELYPRICGIDIKVLTNCRFGMTVWSLLVLTFAFKNYESYGFVSGVWTSTILQTVYFVKFFYWESGYMNTIDIMMDRAGFYICWGCLVFIPGLYASISLYLAKSSESIGDFYSLVVLFAGVASCLMNYWIDLQKQRIRESNGKCFIWGKEAEVIVAEYKLLDGTEKSSVLLVSGFWGLSRHFNYLLELILALCWSIPCGFNHILPYSYFCFLVILLVHRTFRDDTKCRRKYGQYWDAYCKRVPYKILPYVF